MKTISVILIVVSLGLIIAGVMVQIFIDNEPLMTKLYGLGTVILFIVWMPIFLIWRSYKTKLFNAIQPAEENEKSQSNKED